MPPDVRGRLPRTAGWQPALPCTKIILMPDRASIHAVTVTQNTSAFTELMLRTLFLTNELGGFEFRLTVLDNNSSDPEFGALKAYLGAQQIPLVPTGFPYYVAAEQHGAALTDFVRDHVGCTHYLFLDADMWFVEQNTIATMLRELQSAPPNTFAIQARIYGYYVGFVYEGRDGIPGTNAFEHIPTWPIEFEGRTYVNRYATRCSPVCSLIANTPLFRHVVATVGLSQAIRFGIGEVAYHDTFSLMTQVMATHRQQFRVSSQIVNHFTQTSYVNADRSVRERDCQSMIDELREGRGITHPRFRRPESLFPTR